MTLFCVPLLQDILCRQCWTFGLQNTADMISKVIGAVLELSTRRCGALIVSFCRYDPIVKLYLT